MCVGDLATVVEVDVDEGTALVAVGSAERTVSLALHPEAKVGDRVVVHTGFIVDVLSGGAAGEDDGRDR